MSPHHTPQSHRHPVVMAALVAVAAAVLAGMIAMLPGSAQADHEARGPATQNTWHQRVVTVKSSVVTAWGVNKAVRQWNDRRVDGQPILVTRNNIDHPDIVIRGVFNRDGWTGLTEFEVDESNHSFEHITVSLNMKTVHQPAYEYDGSFDAVMQETTSHELGHALGLPHFQNVTRSVMSYNTPWWHTHGLPSAFDFARLARLY